MTPTNALDYIYDLQRIGIKFGLENTLRLLKAMGNPHLELKTIHIAGTNGKGSTAAMVASILKAAGYRVGLYTSPHLIKLSERIQINGMPIPEPDLLHEADEIRRTIEGLHFAESHPTFFETVTCLAFSYFARQGVDMAVVEVGMGGRWDATNVCQPLVSVITNVTLEHQEYLGTTIDAIAREKAGIIKPGCPIVTGAKHEDALKVIREQSAALGAPLYRISEIYSCEEEQGGRTSSLPLADNPLGNLHIKREGRPYLTITPALQGRFQTMNILLAIEVAERLKALGVDIDERAVTEGIRKTVWPGRLQKVSRDPCLLLDGAHNPDAAERLAEVIPSQFDYERLFLVLGILKDKDIAGICRRLVPLADHVILTSPVSDRAASAAELYDTIQADGLAEGRDIAVYPHLADALSHARAHAGTKDLILVTGSLYTIGEAMTLLGVEPYPSEAHEVAPHSI